MPTKKTTARKSARKRSKSKASTGLHPLGKLFFILLSFTAIAVVLIVFTRSRQDATPPAPVARDIVNATELQIALAREGFSPGSIDGKLGGQTTQALNAFQMAHQLPTTGTFDPATFDVLKILDPVYARIELSLGDFNKVAPKPQSWTERGQLDAMHYNSILEMVAEHSHTDPDYIVALNPNLNWQALAPSDQILVPHMATHQIRGDIAYVRIQLSKRILQAFDQNNQLRFHCPVSIARRIDKRPSGQLVLKVLVENPNYTFNPAILSATAAREGITQKFIIQPGPNNPVGNVWIGLNLPSYGIHGTPEPEKVGRTESSGCFRLANWNAKALVKAAWVGMPIQVEP
ncbi:MAG: L,D-transpeptidase family protein [Lentimonas sp.]